jgi:hypothetical protein
MYYGLREIKNKKNKKKNIYFPSIIRIIELSKRSRFSKYVLAKWQ